MLLLLVAIVVGDRSQLIAFLGKAGQILSLQIMFLSIAEHAV